MLHSTRRNSILFIRRGLRYRQAMSRRLACRERSIRDIAAGGAYLGGIVIDAPEFPGWESFRGQWPLISGAVRDHRQEYQESGPRYRFAHGDGRGEHGVSFRLAAIKRIQNREILRAAKEWVVGSALVTGVATLNFPEYCCRTRVSVEDDGALAPAGTRPPQTGRKGHAYISKLPKVIRHRPFSDCCFMPVSWRVSRPPRAENPQPAGVSRGAQKALGRRRAGHLAVKQFSFASHTVTAAHTRDLTVKCFTAYRARSRQSSVAPINYRLTAPATMGSLRIFYDAKNVSVYAVEEKKPARLAR